MALLAGQLIDQIRHRLGGNVSADIGGGINVINLAGRWVFSIHSWRRASRLSATVGFTSGQAYADLPNNCASLIAVDNVTVLGNPVVPVGFAELNRLRTQFPELEGFPIYVAVEHYEKSDGTVGDRLAMHPPPNATDTDALKVSYRGGWADVATPGDVCEIPLALEQLVIHAVREYAAGMEFGDLDMRMVALMQGPVYQAAMHADGDVQPYLGQMRGGAVDMSKSGFDPWDWVTGSTTLVN